jgi:Zn-dependent protease with chaperone function
MGFIYEVVSHLRLTWRLFWDDGVRVWHRSVFLVPLVYLVIPLRYDLFFDLAPLIGLLDDWLLALLCTYLFVFVCPRRVVRRNRLAIALSDPDPGVRERARSDAGTLDMLSAVERLETYRHPQESLALAWSVVLLIGLSALGGLLVAVLLVLYLGFAYAVVRSMHARLLRRALCVDQGAYPQVQASLEQCYAHLCYVPVEVLVVESSGWSAYTFGLERPYTMVLSSQLVEELDADELTVVIGHELGHILYEHTFLSSLLGGLLYQSGLAGLLWSLVFYRWRRLAESTADRIALLACGQLDTAMNALIVLASGGDERVDRRALLDRVYAEERSTLSGHLGGALHARPVHAYPALVTRLRALVDFDAELFALDVEKWLAAEGHSER